MTKEFHQIAWGDQLGDDWRAILRLALREDLDDAGDVTTHALVPEETVGRAAVVARAPGVLAGLPGVDVTLAEMDARLRWAPEMADGRPVEPGDRIGVIAGPTRGLLAAERLVLNLLGHLSGIATQTRRYVEAIRGTGARVYDTRKTTPGWRRLEKYAVRCGGGNNHRTGLYDAVLIKDNHLAVAAQLGPSSAEIHGDTGRHTPAEAVACARRFLERRGGEPACPAAIVEVEVDTLDQLDAVLPAGPDIVLLDNMSPAELREAVARRDAIDRAIELEASGGVTLQTVKGIAASGVDRISVGALTHSASCLDLGLDWLA